VSEGSRRADQPARGGRSSRRADGVRQAGRLTHRGESHRASPSSRGDRSAARRDREVRRRCRMRRRREVSAASGPSFAAGGFRRVARGRDGGGGEGGGEGLRVRRAAGWGKGRRSKGLGPGAGSGGGDRAGGFGPTAVDRPAAPISSCCCQTPDLHLRDEPSEDATDLLERRQDEARLLLVGPSRGWLTTRQRQALNQGAAPNASNQSPSLPAGQPALRADREGD